MSGGILSTSVQLKGYVIKIFCFNDGYGAKYFHGDEIVKLLLAVDRCTPRWCKWFRFVCSKRSTTREQETRCVDVLRVTLKWITTSAGGGKKSDRYLIIFTLGYHTRLFAFRIILAFNKTIRRAPARRGKVPSVFNFQFQLDRNNNRCICRGVDWLRKTLMEKHSSLVNPVRKDSRPLCVYTHNTLRDETTR